MVDPGNFSLTQTFMTASSMNPPIRRDNALIPYTDNYNYTFSVMAVIIYIEGRVLGQGVL